MLKTIACCAFILLSLTWLAGQAVSNSNARARTFESILTGKTQQPQTPATTNAEPYRIKHSSYFSAKNLQSWNPQPLSLPGQLETPDDAGSLKVGLEPGDLTKYSGVPWQADFNECSDQSIDITYEQWNLIYPKSTGDLVQDITQTTYWWPSHRPMQVFTSAGQASWSQGIPNSHAGDLKMVTAWKELGFISDIGQPAGTYVQSERNDPKI